MTPAPSDALVFFRRDRRPGYKKIFRPAGDGTPRSPRNVPVIGVAKSGWTLDQMRARARTA